jgi:hypothetical protein
MLSLSSLINVFGDRLIQQKGRSRCGWNALGPLLPKEGKKTHFMCARAKVLPAQFQPDSDTSFQKRSQNYGFSESKANSPQIQGINQCHLSPSHNKATTWPLMSCVQGQGAHILGGRPLSLDSSNSSTFTQWLLCIFHVLSME